MFTIRVYNKFYFSTYITTNNIKDCTVSVSTVYFTIGELFGYTCINCGCTSIYNQGQSWICIWFILCHYESWCFSCWSVSGYIDISL